MKQLLIANDENERAAEALLVARAWLESNGVETESVSSSHLLLGDAIYHELSQRVAEFDLVCAFGGDGTILRAARVVAGSEIPLLGFNYGTVGFLAGATDASPDQALAAFFSGEVVFEQRVMLQASITYTDSRVAVCSALNEIAVGRVNPGRNICIDLDINGDHLFQLRGDGVIVATATGSTAYALAAGGPLLTPGHRGLCVVPICPHPYATPAIVIAPEDVIELTIHLQSDQASTINIDGQLFAPYPIQNSTGKADALSNEATSIKVVKAPVGLTLVRYDTPDFYTRLAMLFDGIHHAR